MTEYLFPNFLTDPREYEQAEAFWRARWDDVVRGVGQESLWESPWFNTTFANGTPFRDGNPIFSAVSLHRHLGVQVIQLEPADDLEEFTVWTDTFAEGSPEAVKKLVISCVLTKDTLRRAEELMRQWIPEEKVERARAIDEGPTAPNKAGSLSGPALTDHRPPSPR